MDCSKATTLKRGYGTGVTVTGIAGMQHIRFVITQEGGFSQCVSSALLMADSAKLHIEAVKPDKPRVMGLLIVPRW